MPGREDQGYVVLVQGQNLVIHKRVEGDPDVEEFCISTSQMQLGENYTFRVTLATDETAGVELTFQKLGQGQSKLLLSFFLFSLFLLLFSLACIVRPAGRLLNCFVFLFVFLLFLVLVFVVVVVVVLFLRQVFLPLFGFVSFCFARGWKY